MKTRVAVLRGGPSSEYEVSLSTGESVLSSLDKEKYESLDIFIDKNGLWHLGGVPKKPKDALFGVDIVWNALHGEYGEDGKVQTILEKIGVPYTGSRVAASALAMDKAATKKALASVGVKLAHHKIFKKDDAIVSNFGELFKIIPNPSVVKPAAAGSSVGVSIVRTFFDLPEAIESAFAVADIIMIEEYIEGREATVGVVEKFRGKDIYALPAIEIIPPPKDFFSYQAKYGGGSQEICPGNFSDETKNELEKLAAEIHKTLGLSHYSRSDFIVSPKRGIYFLEVNTLPGMTKESLIPKAIRAVGSDIPEFLDHVVSIARERK